MTVTLSDGTTTIDIGQSDEDKSQAQRHVLIPIPGAYGDKVQILGTKQLQFTFKWKMTDFTNRATLVGWEQNITQLTLVDLEYGSGKTVYLASYTEKEIAGIPGIIEVTLQLNEKA